MLMFCSRQGETVRGMTPNRVVGLRAPEHIHRVRGRTKMASGRSSAEWQNLRQNPFRFVTASGKHAIRLLLMSCNFAGGC